MKAKHASWEPSKNLVICSKHFKPDNFAQCLDVQEENGILVTPWLNKRDQCGITAFPSIHAFLLTKAYIIICKSNESLIVEVLPHHVCILWEFALKVTSAPISSPSSRTRGPFIES